VLSREDIFPFDVSPEVVLPLQGRILLRTAGGFMQPKDILSLISQGAITGEDDPDECCEAMRGRIGLNHLYRD